MSSIRVAIHIRCLAVSPILFFPSTDNGHWGRSGRPPWVDEWYKIDWRCCCDPQFLWTYPTHFLYVTVHMWRRVAGPMTYSHLLICALPSSCTYIDLVYVRYLYRYSTQKEGQPVWCSPLLTMEITAVSRATICWWVKCGRPQVPLCIPALANMSIRLTICYCT